MTTKPEYHQHEEFQNRMRKLSELKSLGIDPYPHQFTPTSNAQDLLSKYQDQPVGHSDEALHGQTPLVSVAGRLVLFRSMGKNSFAHIQDETGRIQVMFNRDTTELCGYSPKAEEGEEALSAYKVIEKKIDLGDILGIEGHLFRTNKGELTIFAKKVTLLCKTLLPLADKHAGLADKELRYRKRWLDLISNMDVQQTFRLRSKILQFIRQYFQNENFIEVETPVLQSIYGGAEARPFVTTLNALEQEMFLRISLEIPLKKLIIGGMNRVFEIGRVFRNEGIDRNHNPEFTLMEAYAAYWDYNDMMRLVENLFEKLALEIYGKTQVPAVLSETGEEIFIDFKAPWPRLKMKESIQKYANLNVDDLTDEAMKKLLLESGHVDQKKIAGMSRGLLIAALFAVFVEHHLIQPHHIIDHPIETTPLCKLHRNQADKDLGIVERFESFVLGQEICNAYSELNDPILQRSLLEKQADRRDAGDEEASPLDEEFIEAICQGMPPTGGVGIGIDRLVMLMTNAHSIRDVLFFPWMKTQE
ncbi:MAG: lysine--tRNA ligase [Chlamydiales bacterium 38-26]|nr:lysine--tRNA ligase [Chlamydiales bacterium]OJV09475.1 MAG: lysine--tRNA ligase [Chlamydiales bacterium 38-26]